MTCLGVITLSARLQIATSGFIMSGRPGPFNWEALRALIDRLTVSDRQTILAMCSASEAVWEMFQTMLMQVVTEDTDRFLRDARYRSYGSMQDHNTSTIMTVRADDNRPFLHVGSRSTVSSGSGLLSSGSDTRPLAPPPKSMPPHRGHRRHSRSRSRRRT